MRLWSQNAPGSAQERIVSGGKAEPEFTLQLLVPLANQRSWCQHQGAFGHAAKGVLREHHAGFNGLAEANFVGQQNAAAKTVSKPCARSQFGATTAQSQ